MRIPLFAVMPVLNDSASAIQMTEKLLLLFDQTKYDFNILIVNDGSKYSECQNLEALKNTNEKINLLNNEVKTGHQAAIYKGLKWISKNYEHHHVLVMDADGEDNPLDSIFLLEKLLLKNETKAVVAKRAKRKSTIAFKSSYNLFKLAFKLLTGKQLESGNFFAIRSNWIPTFMEIPTSTNHASVSIIRYCPEFEMVTLNRSKRFEGKSKMNLASLALHGYGALAVYADIVFSRLLILVALIATMLYSTGGIIFLIKIFKSDLLLPGWSSNVILILIGFATLLLFNFFSSTLLLLKINSESSRKVVG